MSEETQPDKPKRKVSQAEIENVCNYMVIDISYDLNICLPYKHGVAFLAALECAENVSTDRYGDKPIQFKPKAIQFTSRIVNQREYREAKMNLLLGVDDE